MRDDINTLRSSAHLHDVVVVGNGPSAITLSYMLAGNRPFYDGAAPSSIPPHLHHRLAENQHVSLMQQDLEMLSDGLFGRSSNPVSVLYDTLNHPRADLGEHLPSLLQWRSGATSAVDHVVLGRGPAGGVWQKLSGELMTVSLGSWLELPGLSFSQWCRSADRVRVKVADVARYYADYVHTMGLESYFRDHSMVQSVRRLGSRPEDHFLRLISGTSRSNHRKTGSCTASTDSSEGPLWLVEGIRESDGGGTTSTGRLQRFRYVARTVVLACGGSEVPARLLCPGEQLPLVSHQLCRLEAMLTAGRLSGPLLVVGAGLSAADVILAARRRGVSVVHAFRRRADDRALIYYSLPTRLYSEYHQVHRMMRAGAGSWPHYRPLSETRLTHIDPSGRVTLQSPQGTLQLTVGHVAILIGSRPALDFVSLCDNDDGGGGGLGVDPARPVDGRSNPVDVDLFTHRSLRAPGLYALGPLIGDNFIRFVQGAALSVATDLCRRFPPGSAPACRPPLTFLPDSSSIPADSTDSSTPPVDSLNVAAGYSDTEDDDCSAGSSSPSSFGSVEESQDPDAGLLTSCLLSDSSSDCSTLELDDVYHDVAGAAFPIHAGLEPC